MKVENVIVNNITRFNSVGGRLGRGGIIFNIRILTLGQKTKDRTTSMVKYICQQRRSY